ncbi:MAG TPA: 1-(5-phosphoribosyl)-5-amino-4-imidazole-carboxylate carboxylase, partial [Candidatus Brocadiia bacterium]|nr:1-(5-phosphoribosyl)-5-amino-4-imidazole-carboxylate carboxylase [Candidatus Brocadiia bacterium]
MDEARLRQLLQRLADGRESVDSAVQALRDLPFEDLGFARVDGHRAIRCGFPEVIFCPGKTTSDTLAIAERLAAHGGSLLATRVPPETAQALAARFPGGVFNERARTFLLKRGSRPRPPGKIVILSAGTSDIPVAEEARVTAEAMDNDVIALYDVGVAGIHRLLSHRQTIMSASVVVV